MAVRKTMLLIGGGPAHLRKACAVDADVVYVQFREEFRPEYGAMVKSAILTDYTDWNTLRPLVEAAHEVWGFSAVTSLTEPGLDPAGRVNDLLGLGGTSYEVSHRFTDKWLMRRRLAEQAPADVPPVGAALMTGRDSIAEFGARYGYPFIVKPAGGTASFGVLRVSGPDSIGSVWQQIRELREDSDHPLIDPYDLNQYVMEEYIEGPLYSAETFSFGGRHVVMAITERATPDGSFVHVGHATPARLDPAVEDLVTTAMPRFLDAMGLRDGNAHTEFKVTESGLAIIESQNRIGGSLIHLLIKSVYGVDPQTLAFSWPLGLADELTGRPAANGGAASWLVVAEPGRVVDIQGVDEVRADPAVLAVETYVGLGDVVREFDGEWDGVAHIAAHGGDVGAASSICRRNLAKLKIRTEREDAVSERPRPFSPDKVLFAGDVLRQLREGAAPRPPAELNDAAVRG
jgi:biotin carboxylase